MLIWWALRIWTAYANPEDVFVCDPVDGPRLEWTAEQRKAVRELSVIEWRRQGAKGPALAYIDAVTVRESSGAPSRWHDDGTGLGAHGLNVEYFGEGVNLCDPRKSADRALSIARAAVMRYGAKTPWDVQAVFAGRHECVTGVGRCTGAMQDRTTEAICGRMERRGYSCHEPVTREDLGL